MSRVWLVSLAALLCACTQDFNKFLGDAGSSDDGGADSAPACPPVPQTCLASASSCGQSCVSGYNTCVGACGNNQGCKSQCKNQEGTCNSVCISTCTSCADAGTCAQTGCQAAVP